LVVTQFVYHKAGNSEAQQKIALAFMLAQDSTGIATDGVLSGLGVAQTTTASSSVVIGKGAAVVLDTLLAGAGRPGVVADLTRVVLGRNPMGGVPRNDLIVFDTATVSAGTGGVRAIIGTPNAIPTDPSVPATAVALFRVANAASATTIPTSALTDLRVFTGLGRPGPDTGWINMPIPAGGWTAPSGARWQARRQGNVVRYQGTLANSTYTGGWTTICTLPTGVPAPLQTTALSLGGNTATVRSAQVLTTGEVQVYASAASAAWYVIGGQHTID
jgi:hypothetical protein